jgi:hypothetical protein
MHLILLARFVAQISTSSSILVPLLWVLYDNFIAYFLVIPAELAWSQVIK